MRDTQLTVNCFSCKQDQAVKVNEKDLENYNNGAHAQHVFPYLSADERELLISGICGCCFDKMFEGDEDES
ncbi:hypothetical protein [Paenibacillus sp. Marseille-Q4541]|uniref:hypothetical protein n=1 Tax=Paenibacillus sp. Marseille-Q4541 TaxID=2831522 RepID=UPI001BAA3115|nr:hypothetical protein [Paenibacillus sp. Marseille-Q4541]